MSTTDQPMSDQIDHRAEAERGMGSRISPRDVTPTEHLLAAIHDEQQAQTGLLADLLTDLLEVLRPKGDPCPCGCRRDVEPTEPKPSCGCGRTLPCRHCEADDAWTDTLLAALYTLPIGTVIYDCNGDRWTKDGLVWWVSDEAGQRGTNVMATFVPIGIEHIPGEDVLPTDRLVGEHTLTWEAWADETRRFATTLPTESDPEPDTLVEAMDVLPVGSVVYDGVGYRWRKEEGDRWRAFPLDQNTSVPSRFLATFAPIGIESIPGEDVQPHQHEWNRKQNVTSRGYAMEAIEVCACGEARKAEPEPESVTVTRVPIPERNRLTNETEAEWARRVADQQDMDYRRSVGEIAAEGLLTSQIIRKYADALDSANTPPAPPGAREDDDEPPGYSYKALAAKVWRVEELVEEWEERCEQYLGTGNFRAQRASTDELRAALAHKSDDEPQEAPEGGEAATGRTAANLGRIGWLTILGGRRRWLAREVPGGWTTSLNGDEAELRGNHRTFTPLTPADFGWTVIGEGQVAVDRDDLLRAVRDADWKAITRLRAALDGDDRE